MRRQLACGCCILLKRGSDGVLTDEPRRVYILDSTNLLKGTCTVSIMRATCNTVCIYLYSACHSQWPLPGGFIFSNVDM